MPEWLAIVLGVAGLLLTIGNLVFASGRWTGKQERGGNGNGEKSRQVEQQLFEERLHAFLAELRVEIRHDIRGIMASEKADRYLNHEDRLQQLEGQKPRRRE